MRPPWQSRGGPATPLPLRRAAETAASPRQMEPRAFLVSLLRAKKRRVAGAKGGTGPGPHHRCQEKRPRLWRDPAGRAPGRNRCNLSPSALEPALSSCPRSFSFAHSRGVASSPSHRRRPATNPDGNKKNPDQTRRSRCFVSFPQWEQRYVFFYKSTKFKVH